MKQKKINHSWIDEFEKLKSEVKEETKDENVKR